MRIFDLNKASRNELIDLKGLGKILAEKIIARRKKRLFQSDLDLITLEGIGAQSLEQMKKINQVHLWYGQYKAFEPIISLPITIRMDGQGSGEYHSSRGHRLHKGIDINCKEHQHIYAPFTGRFNKFGYPYAGNYNLRYLELVGMDADSNYRIRIMYAEKKPSLQVGDLVKRGDTIGSCQAISQYYNPSIMDDHLHIELYINGENSDPTPYILTAHNNTIT